MLAQTIVFNPSISTADDPVSEEMQQQICATPEKNTSKKVLKEDIMAAWQEEAASIDRSVRILPSVKEMIASIPEGRYAVATSGAKTYGTFILLPLLATLTSSSFT